ncbi:hypothetical protein RhiirB3_443002 [Rhizophagus irregularis]|nr:hypothetical protein RhiirB3_443002 [Rhizophagus irregularis]
MTRGGGKNIYTFEPIHEQRTKHYLSFGIMYLKYLLLIFVFAIVSSEALTIAREGNFSIRD